MAGGLDLSLDAALAESARHQDAVRPVEAGDAAAFDLLGVHVVDLDPGAGMDARVNQRLGE